MSHVFDRHRPGPVFHLGAILGQACDIAAADGHPGQRDGAYHELEVARLFRVRQDIFASSIT
jgi:hypothetical protein